MLTLWKKSYGKPRQYIKNQRHQLVDKGPYGQSCDFFPCSHVQMWELDHKESWMSNTWCFWIVVLENTLENLLDCQEIKPVHPKGGQPWILIGTELMLKLQYFSSPMQRANSLEKTLMLERLKAGGEGDDRGWSGWMASLTQWTWVWANSERWWRTGKPGVLYSMGSQNRTWLSNWITASIFDIKISFLL